MKRNKRHILVIFVAVFFVVYSYIPLTSPVKFTSPDENLNYFFSELYAASGTLSYSEELGKIARGPINPRSTWYLNGKVVPSGFLGMYVIFGTLALFERALLLYITPMLSSIGILFFYLFVKENFDDKNALLSSALLLTLPPYWYWTSQTMYANIPALVFFIGGLLYFFRLLKEKKLFYYILSAFFISVSLLIRLDYALLLIPLFIISFLKFKRLSTGYLFLSVMVSILVLFPHLFLNNDLYNGYLTTAQSLNSSQIKISEFSSQVLPSFNLKIIFHNMIRHYVELLPLLFFGVILTTFISIRYKKHTLYLVYFLFTASVVFGYWGLGIYYGFKEKAGISSSYTRFFLLVYILSLPFVAEFIKYFLDIKRRRVLPLLFCVTYIISSVNLTILSADGILAIQRYKEKYSQISNEILTRTDKNAIFVTNYWDKMFFPDRRVIVPYFYRNVADLSDVIHRLATSKARYPIYIVKDPVIYISGHPLRLDYIKFENLLEKHNLGMKEEYLGVLTVYKIVPK